LSEYVTEKKHEISRDALNKCLLTKMKAHEVDGDRESAPNKVKPFEDDKKDQTRTNGKEELASF
jgi:iron-sulfur cluster repair protein YtfE (RIC family)